MTKSGRHFGRDSQQQFASNQAAASERIKCGSEPAGMSMVKTEPALSARFAAVIVPPMA